MTARPLGRATGLALLLAGFTAACRGEAVTSTDGGAPAPTSSVISLGIELGACTDIAICDRECEGGSGDRCRRLAMSFAFGRGVPRDEARGTELFEKACRLGDPSSCLFAGQMYEYEHGVAKDEVRAARYYELSCQLSWVAGCYNLGVMYERGAGVRADPARAMELYEQACHGGSTSACGKAKELAEEMRVAAGPLADLLDGGGLPR